MLQLLCGLVLLLLVLLLLALLGGRAAGSEGEYCDCDSPDL
jgi:hypothetical protein